jgi:hypothetical protein
MRGFHLRNRLKRHIEEIRSAAVRDEKPFLALARRTTFLSLLSAAAWKAERTQDRL